MRRSIIRWQCRERLINRLKNIALPCATGAEPRQPPQKLPAACSAVVTIYNHTLHTYIFAWYFSHAKFERQFKRRILELQVEERKPPSYLRTRTAETLIPNQSRHDALAAGRFKSNRDDMSWWGYRQDAVQVRSWTCSPRAIEVLAIAILKLQLIALHCIACCDLYTCVHMETQVRAYWWQLSTRNGYPKYALTWKERKMPHRRACL